MGKLLVYVFLVFGSTISLFRPWIGVCLVYLIIILTPHAIWWWDFQGLRPVFYILAPTIIGFGIAFIQRRINIEIIKNRRNLYLLVLWIFFVLSYYFGPYMGKPSPYWFHDPNWTFALANKIFILYFVACMTINDKIKTQYLAFIMVISTIYMIYWINEQYFILHRYGRLGGPTDQYGGSVYADQNAFAMFFVTGLPFIYYLGWYLKNKLLRYTLWLIVPFGWHAIFLTGSRGGLLGLCTIVLVAALRSPKRIIGLALIPLFIVTYFWQAGPVMRQRTATITQYEQEGSAQGRINAWKVATKMISHHPLFGVGLSAFGPAFPDFSDERPREAHNTFFQIAAESGIIAGLMYLLVLWTNLKDLLRNSRILREQDDKSEFLFYLNEALLTSLIGFVVCSMFLSLQVYEIFYYLCVLINAITYISLRYQQLSQILRLNQKAAV